MKVKFTSGAKKFVTVSQLPAIKRIIAEMKDDTGLESYAKSAAIVASGCNCDFEILRSEAEIARNSRANNAYFDDSGDLDIWLHIYAYDWFAGFFEISVFLTDVWSITGSNPDEIRSHMYIREYRHKYHVD